MYEVIYKQEKQDAEFQIRPHQCTVEQGQRPSEGRSETAVLTLIVYNTNKCIALRSFCTPPKIGKKGISSDETVGLTSRMDNESYEHGLDHSMILPNEED